MSEYDEPVDVTVKVTAVKEQELPELDDEFAQSASEFDTVDELSADITDRVLRAARLEQAAAARDAVLEKLLSLVDVPLPEGAVEDEKANRRASFAQQLAYAEPDRGAVPRDRGADGGGVRRAARLRVRDAMVAQFVLEEIANVEEMAADEEELGQLLLRRAQENGISPEKYIEHALEHNHIPELVGEVRRGKALAHVVESATVTDASGNHVELVTLMPDGTYAEPAQEEETEAMRAAAGPLHGRRLGRGRRRRLHRRRTRTPTRPKRVRRRRAVRGLPSPADRPDVSGVVGLRHATGSGAWSAYRAGPPGTVAQQDQDRGQDDDPDQRGVDEHRDGQTDPDLLELEQAQRREDREHRHHDRGRTGHDPRRLTHSPLDGDLRGRPFWTPSRTRLSTKTW